MASLESLANPIERLGVLPQAVNLNVNPLTGDPTWDVARQYFQNDIAISGIDGGAYILNSTSTTLKGGVDPALDGGASWQKTFPNGVSYYDSLATTFTASGSNYTISGTGLTGAKYVAPAGSAWQVIWQGTATIGTGTLSAGDWIQLTMTADGTGGLVQSVNVSPQIGSASTGWSVSAYIEVGTGGTGITLTASREATDAQALTGRATFIRVF